MQTRIITDSHSDSKKLRGLRVETTPRARPAALQKIIVKRAPWSLPEAVGTLPRLPEGERCKVSTSRYFCSLRTKRIQSINHVVNLFHVKCKTTEFGKTLQKVTSALTPGATLPARGGGQANRCAHTRQNWNSFAHIERREFVYKLKLTGGWVQGLTGGV
eukprot:TRINITY_DN37620_c0_g1_i1.p1 TRINITY_DN37620_c0_g1~~TRINITY_DN37620_c0_g1_i1.p1  ORF type:complete len:160 (-),score=1.66 TRINITY_DN37620_c0_g1_i1:242-721(-)